MTVSAIARLLTLASSALVLLAGLGAFFTMLVVTADVVFRFFGTGIPGTLELVTYYLMIMVVFLPLARVERLEQTITVDVFTSALSRRSELALTLGISLLCAGLYGTLGYLTWFDALTKAAAGAYILTDRFPLPVWPAYFVPPVAFALAVLICLLRCVEIVTGTYRPHGGEVVEDMGSQLDGSQQQGHML
jgi:TRAP-type C4-dicarboxylate transport system permease small subunit